MIPMDFLRDPCSDQSFAMFDVPKVLVIHLNSCHFRCWISEICTHPTCIFAVFLLLLLPKIEKKAHPGFIMIYLQWVQQMSFQ